MRPERGLHDGHVHTVVAGEGVLWMAGVDNGSPVWSTSMAEVGLGLLKQMLRGLQSLCVMVFGEESKICHILGRMVIA